MGRVCTAACRNRSSPITMPVCAGLDEKMHFMHTYFGEQSIGCFESNAMTPVICRHSPEYSNLLDKILVGTRRCQLCLVFSILSSHPLYRSASVLRLAPT